MVNGGAERLSDGFDATAGDSTDLVAHAIELLFGGREIVGPEDVMDYGARKTLLSCVWG
jgi:hypothetical protein